MLCINVIYTRSKQHGPALAHLYAVVISYLSNSSSPTLKCLAYTVKWFISHLRYFGVTLVDFIAGKFDLGMQLLDDRASNLSF